MRYFVISFVCVMLLSIHCDNDKVTQLPGKPIEQVLSEHTDALMQIPGVVGTAQGMCDDVPCIKVLVERNTPELEKRIPRTLEGWKVVVEEVGTVRAL